MIATRDTELDLAAGSAGESSGDGAAVSMRRTVVVSGCVAVWVAGNAVAMTGEPFRWWANFVILPGLVLLGLSAGLGRAARETRFVLAWAGAIVLVTGWLLLAGEMGARWPLMIIVPCLGPAALFGLRPADPSVRAFVDTVAGLAVVGVGLGVMFLLIRENVVGFGRLHWWSWFMLAAAGVLAINGMALLVQRRGTYWFSMAVLLMALGGYTVLAGLAELNR